VPRRPKPCTDCATEFVPTNGHAKRCRACVRGSNQHRSYDPPLSPAIRAYLADFTRFILESKSTGDEDAHAQAARDKAVTFAATIEDTAVTRSERGQRIAGFPKGHSFRRRAA
jgi:hypothetical protein